MRILALDISTTTTGYAVLDEKSNLIKSGQFSMGDRGLSDIIYSNAIKEKVKSLVEKFKATDLIIEDVFYGKNINNLKTWCRVHGAVGNYWYEYANIEPAFLMAVSARKLNDMHGQCTKIEVQLEMAKLYKLVEDDTYYEYCGKLGKLLTDKKNKTITKNKFDYQVKKICREFEKDTGISEHIADAVLLGRAYIIDKQD